MIKQVMSIITTHWSDRIHFSSSFDNQGQHQLTERQEEDRPAPREEHTTQAAMAAAPPAAPAPPLPPTAFLMALKGNVNVSAACVAGACPNAGIFFP